jgi:probable rRNA maturation factor
LATISFHIEDVSFELSSKLALKSWIKEVISFHHKKQGSINYIFCSDEYLLGMNRQYLQHDEYTDIITFDYTEDKIVSGDIFISIERVHDNAQERGIEFLRELYRVMIHGVLHLTGLKDKTELESSAMRKAEDQALEMFPVKK